MKKVVSSIVLIAFLLTLTAALFTGCGLFKSISYDDVKLNLKEAGYEITEMTGKEYVASDDANPFIMEYELERYLYAVKGDDVLHLFIFTTIDNASRNMDTIGFSGLTQGQSNEVVYCATKQAASDAKI